MRYLLYFLDLPKIHFRWSFAQWIRSGDLGFIVIRWNCFDFQEEIRFLISPELIVSCLVCEVMEDNESILIGM